MAAVVPATQDDVVAVVQFCRERKIAFAAVGRCCRRCRCCRRGMMLELSGLTVGSAPATIASRRR